MADRTCSESGCNVTLSPFSRASLCVDHRFWIYVAAPDERGCWPWIGSMGTWGYGLYTVENSRKARAHRWAYEHLIGPIPAGLHLDHLCRNRACVNPAHLEPVTPRENTLRGETFAAANAAKTQCPRGHELAGANLRTHNGSRHCRSCERERMRRTRAERKGKLDASTG